MKNTLEKVVLVWLLAMKRLCVLFIAVLLLSACATNPMTGKSTMAFVHNNELFPQSFAMYQEILDESTIVTGTPEATMVARVGARIAEAARKWLASEGNESYLNDYAWEYKLLDDKTVNAWCLPGGKIGVYTGLLPITKTEEGLAVVLGHEVAHALLNHGQQRMSAGLLQQLGAVGLQVGMGAAGLSGDTQILAMAAFGVGTQVGGMLPFNRSHESESDHYGLMLMAIAGYNPEAAPLLWERMESMSGGGAPPEFLSTHPSHATRIRQLQGWVPEAKQKAAEFGVRF